MDLPELAWIELCGQILQCFAYERLIVDTHDTRVLVVGLKVQHVAYRDELDGAARRGLQPAQRTRRLLRPGPAEGGVDVGRRGADTEACLQAQHGARQPGQIDRLDHVVDGAGVEGFHRVVIEGGDEHDVHAAGQGARHRQPVRARHAHVEKPDVRRRPHCRGDGLVAVGGVVHDRQSCRKVAAFCGQRRAPGFAERAFAAHLDTDKGFDQRISQRECKTVERLGGPREQGSVLGTCVCHADR
jgi:hypothetical protein